MSNDLQETILTSCPSIYGNDVWPLYLLVFCFLVILSVSIQRLVFECLKPNKFFMKIMCLIFLSLFVMMELVFLIVPFPHSFFSDMLYCDHLPRFSVFVSFQFLCLWLGGVVFSNYSSSNFCSLLNLMFLCIFN
jgi:hypothetical protein